MVGEPVELEDLLRDQDQATAAMRATIEQVEDPDRVRITPFVPDVGCLCSVALTVRKDAVGSLVRTDELHRCCGKALSVVEVDLADETLRDVFSQLVHAVAASTSTHYPGSQDPFPAEMGDRAFSLGADAVQRRNARCQENYETCLESAVDDFDRCMCRNAYNMCVSPQLPQFRCPPPAI